MSLRLYDTLSRSVRDFVPIEPGRASMYQCGPTVQSDPHVGHIRCGVVFDLLSRWLLASGYEVVLVRNVTDIDDKVLNKAVVESRPWWAVASYYEREFRSAYDVLGCLPPTNEPRATGHITQMIELISRLIDSGHAYYSAGDVYFDVRSYPEYGQLSRQRIDDLLPAADSDTDLRKRDPRDFALWKAAKPGEPAWPTPWGPGRPGWHIECSAMARAYLGPVFDIHGGGLDLVFPHHENEIAQSRAAGDGFANYWLHNAWVTTAGEKMSKSLGNTLVVSHVIERIRPVELRWYLIAAHYRSNLEFSDKALAESAASYRRIEGFVVRAHARIADSPEPSPELLPEQFSAALDDDLSVPAALAVLHDRVTSGNRMMTSGDDAQLGEVVAQVRSMLDVLGVDPLSATWRDQSSEDSALRTALDVLVTSELQARQQARAARDFAAADAIRDRITSAGILIEDSAEGSRWSLAGQS
ncbi:MAG: cysteine--tRNA ligase [Actinomycetes bacterium]